MRKKIVAGNWKMHGSRKDVVALTEEIKQGVQHLSADIIVFPSFIHIPTIEHLLKNTPIAWGGQNLHTALSGAFTGEISGPMLVDYGCRYVLVGHSERRHLFGESLEMVAAKFKIALQCGLIPVLCVGETRAEREQGQTETILTQQIDAIITSSGIEALKQAVIAYEPVWAIGTGLTATPDQAEAAHVFIRQHLAEKNVAVADSMRIIYGGSVKGENAEGLFAMPNIDGGLVGGASLNAKEFLQICRAVKKGVTA